MMTSMLPDGRPPFPNLESLDLEQIGVYGPGLSQLKNLPRLRQLNFQQAGIGDDGIAELRHVRGFANCSLRLLLVATGAVGLSKLRNLEHLATIRVVICDEGARRFRRFQTSRPYFISPMFLMRVRLTSLD